MTEWELPDAEEAEAHKSDIIHKLLKECPQFEPDPRQEHLFAYIDKMRKDETLEDPQIISMSGFRASCVDLGWIRDRFEKLVKTLYLRYGPYYIMPIMDAVIGKTVQRLKSQMMHYDSGRATIEVLFVTKDDEGSYEYRLGIPTPIEDRGQRE